MVCADNFIAVGDVGFFTQKQGTVVGHVVEKIVRVARHYLHVFAGNAISLREHLFLCVAKNNLPIIAPRLSSNLGCRQSFELLDDFRLCVFNQFH